MENGLEYILQQIQSGELDPEEGWNRLEELRSNGWNGNKTSSLLFMENKWVEMPLNRQEEVPPEAFTLIFAEEESDWAFINNAVIVTKGENFQQVSPCSYQIALNSEEQYQILSERLKLQKKGCIQIIHQWSVRQWESKESEIKKQLMEGLYSMFYLLKALRNVNKKVYLTYAYHTEKNMLQPQYAAMGGFLKTVMLEKSNVVAKKVEIQGLSRVEACKIIREESMTAGGDVEVCYRDGKRFVKQMIEAVMEEGILPLKKNATYLITGGLGGIGYIFASYLAKHWNANLILTGRSGAKQDKLMMLKQFGSKVIYVQADVSEKEQVRRLVNEAKKHTAHISGVLHAAGNVRDAYLMNKETVDIQTVLAPKVFGTVWLMQELQQEKLDFFTMFSAGAGLTGNIGQCDYAYANCFLDEYSLMMNRQNTGQRIVSINWPLWKDGGMQVSEDTKNQMKEQSGMVPLSSENGLLAFERILKGDAKQVLVAEGDCEKIRSVFQKGKRDNGSRVRTETKPKKQGKLGKDEILPLLLERLSEMISQILKINMNVIDPEADFIEFGFDSISFTTYSNMIQEVYEIEVMPSIFFDFLNLESLAEYMVDEYEEEICTFYNTELVESADTERNECEEESNTRKDFSEGKCSNKIAVIGMSAILPKSDDIDEFWQHVIDGDDLIDEIPLERWDWKRYYGDPVTEEGKTNIKWGGFMNDIRSFDASFFGIPAPEAEMMDPQQRLFMQTVWHAIEDAGYKASNIAGTKTSLFVGVASIDYNQLMQEERTDVQAHSATGVSHSVLANRLSYLLDIHGQSEPIDTACSSSLIAIHEAMESLIYGGCEMAIAGGVNVIACPDVYISFSKAGMLSPTGNCKTFDDAADGYVRGEGCGAILLKPLEKAVKDGDHIYGILLGSSVNHGGHAATLTAPNPNAQAQVITSAWEKAGIDPFSVSYIEAHGTGTRLGDSVEIEGLKKAYAMEARRQGISMPDETNCMIGTVKTQIGHLETAAGIASVIKVLLCLKHKKLAGNLHFKKLNSYISLKGAPFSIMTGTKEWDRRKDCTGKEIHRRAGVSCFGFGGANAHLILEEFESSDQDAETEEQMYLFPLSAKSKEALYCYAYKMQQFLRKTEESLSDIVYTLWNGREEMQERLILLVENKEEAEGLLQDIFNEKQTISEVCHLKGGREGQFKDLYQIGSDWLKGSRIRELQDVKKLRGKKCSIPGYPFEKEEYWLPKAKKQENLFAHTMCFTQVWEKDTNESKAQLKGSVVKQLLIFSDTGLKPIAFSGSISIARKQKSYTKITSAEYGINPLREQDYIQLFEEMEKEGGIPDVLIHGWMHEEQSQEDMECFFYFLKALSKVAKKETEVLILYRKMSKEGQITYRSFTAMLRSVMQENPNIQGKVIEIDGVATNHDVEGILSTELTEISQEVIDICYRGQERYTRKLQETRLNPEQQGAVQRRGAYIISGGMGGIGTLLTKHLVKTRQADIVLLGRSPLTPDKKREIQKLQQYGSSINYYSCDITKEKEMEELISTIAKQFGKITGIFHCAGVNEDGMLKEKTFQAFEGVISPKTKGYEWMRQLAEKSRAGFLMCFSSVVGIFGNQGQADYAFANSYMNESVIQASKDSDIRYISVNWPLWEEGGMRSNDQIIDSNRKNGIYLLPVMEAMNIIDEILADDGNEYIILYGDDRAKGVMESSYKRNRFIVGIQQSNDLLVQDDYVETQVVREKTREFLKNLFAQMLRVRKDEIREDATFQEYGVDSLIVNQFNVKVAGYFKGLSKTLLFECNTIGNLTDYFVKNQRGQLLEMFGMTERQDARAETSEIEGKVTEIKGNVPDMINEQAGICDIAIIGMSGRYPGSNNLYEFWENLKAGKDLVSEIPKDRWDIDEYYDQDPNKASDGKMYCRMGGFVKDVDEFDPLFFGISKREAERMDPQERLFIETAWAAFEDAGYTKERIHKECVEEGREKVGVFVGMTTHTYMLWGPEECQKGNVITPNMSTWSAANRISYLMDLNGPSMTVDTACSSSLTALHLACESIYRGESRMALAGGVNLYLHPSKYVTLSIARMLSPTGKCHSFGKDSDGFVPGEGVGAFLIKPLWKAEADQDHIYAVIKATAVNHGGATNGFTVPNPNMQAKLIKDAMKKGNIEPESISYIEAHGTGTALGDPIEITGLAKAFQQGEGAEPFCSVGSVKSNIGHLEAAAGVASITKVILQMQHKMLVPSLHSRELNPNLTLDKTPFYIQQELENWNMKGRVQENRRRAGISAFGAGGANVHIILEEYPDELDETPANMLDKNVILLSAQNKECLKAYAEEILLFTEREYDSIDQRKLNRIAYTLQMGRAEMEERLAMTAGSLEELRHKLKLYLEDSSEVTVYCGKVKKKDSGLAALIQGEEGKHFIAELVEKGNIDKLAQLWVEGVAIDWMQLYKGIPVKTMSLPTYPFKKEHFFVKRTDRESLSASNQKQFISVKDPYCMISDNCSTFRHQYYINEIDTTEFYLRDHILGSEKILPGVCYLEVARQAGEAASEQQVVKIKNMIWAKPVIVKCEPIKIYIELKEKDSQAGYEISTIQKGEKCIHAQGNLVFKREMNLEADHLEITEIRERCHDMLNGASCYQRFRQIGFQYGPSFQGIQELYRGDGEALSKILLPEVVIDSLDLMKLQPSIMDAALQTVTGAMNENNCAHAAFLPFSLGELTIHRALEQECYGYVKQTNENRNNCHFKKFEVCITDVEGNVLVSIKDFCVKALQDDSEKKTSREMLSVKADNKVKFHQYTWTRKDVWIDEGKLKHNILFLTNRDTKNRYFSHVKVQVETPMLATYKEWQEYIEQKIDFKHVDAVAWISQAEQPSASSEKLQEQIESQIISVFHMCKALDTLCGQQKNTRIFPVLNIILSESDRCGSIQTSLSGFGRTLTSENPKLAYKTVEIIPPLAQTDEKTVQQMWNCASIETSVQDVSEVRYLQGQRMVKTLKEVKLEQLPARTCKIKENGVYLIAGGVGGLGILFAKQFARTDGVKLALLGRSKRNKKIQSRVEELKDMGVQVLYLEADIASKEELEQAIRKIKETWGKLDGVVHCAGIVRDSYITKKSDASFREVLAPKINGMVWLDDLLRDEPLDFFLAFSSTAAIIGNPGQSDYACGNYFMNVYGEMREQFRKEGLRSGETVIFNWPLWKNGGMQVDKSTLKWLIRKSGTIPLEDQEGVWAFNQIMEHQIYQPIISQYAGEIVPELCIPAKSAETVEIVKRVKAKEVSGENLIIQCEAEIKAICAEILKVEEDEIDREEELINYGLDSIAMMTMINKMEEFYQQPVDANILTEYCTIEALAEHMVAEGIFKHSKAAKEEETVEAEKPVEEKFLKKSISTVLAEEKYLQDKIEMKAVYEKEETDKSDKIAVIGIACRFPQSDNLEEYWENLKTGTDMITEVPAKRWDVGQYFSNDRNEAGKTYCKWGGFTSGIYEFAANYFKISDVDAVIIDPHHRIMLELADELFYRSGYQPGEMSGTKTGVFIGGGESNYVKNNMGKIPNEYMKHGLINNIPNMMAARISDFYNLKGSSKTVDSACSSSLVALHDACQAIRTGDCDMAIAGGIEILVDAQIHVAFSKAEVLSKDGKCKVFDENADGMVPGEGAGMVLLKPYDQAIEDGNTILGVILGSAVNNDGHTMGLTVPGIDGQKEVIAQAIKKSKISPRSISYLETHGTGTLLGDPIEIRAASLIYQDFTDKRQFCAVGSVKSNIGHLMRAAGIASFIKVILALHHKWIPKTLHCKNPHPRFRFEQSPFYPELEGKEWFSNDIRRAAISSFGFGGTNCHMIVEEYIEDKKAVIYRKPLKVKPHDRKHYEFSEWIASTGEAEQTDDGLLAILDEIENGELDSVQAELLIQSLK